MTFFVSFGGQGGSAVRSSFGPALYREFFPRDEQPPVVPEDFAERAARYAGTYGFWRSNFSTIEKALGLTGGVTIAPTEDNTLIMSFAGKAKQYAEVEENLFRETDSGISLIAGISPRLLAFQESPQGEISGFVMEGLPFMSLRKLPAYATPNFNFALLGLSFLVFLLVLLRRFFQRAAIRALPAADRGAFGAADYQSTFVDDLTPSQQRIVLIRKMAFQVCGDVVEAEFFEPLGMDNTVTSVTDLERM